MHEIAPVPMSAKDFRAVIRGLQRMQDQLILHQRSCREESRQQKMARLAVHFIHRAALELDIMFHTFEVWLEDEDDPRICYRYEGWFLDSEDPNWVKDDKHPDIAKVIPGPRFWERRFEKEGREEGQETLEETPEVQQQAHGG